MIERFRQSLFETPSNLNLQADQTNMPTITGNLIRSFLNKYHCFKHIWLIFGSVLVSGSYSDGVKNYTLNSCDITYNTDCKIPDKLLKLIIPLVAIVLSCFSFITAFLFVLYDLYYRPTIYKLTFTKHPKLTENSSF